jgi:hypothetical protein
MSPLILDGGQAAEMADGGEEEREEEEIEVEEGVCWSFHTVAEG